MKLFKTSLVLVAISWVGNAVAQAPMPPSSAPPTSAPTAAAPELTLEEKAKAEREKKKRENACYFRGNSLSVNGTRNLVVRLVNPPTKKVTLSIDRAGGFHHELVWDPTVGDGLKHDVLLESTLETPAPANEKPESSGNDYTLMAYADEDRIQTTSMVVLMATRFRADDLRHGATTALVGEQTTRVLAATGPGAPNGPNSLPSGTVQNQLSPRLQLECETEGVEMSKQYLDTKRLYAASVSRGFLDQAAPAVITDTLALLAEIAVERAKDSALELVKERFVTPMCTGLKLKLLGLGGEEQVFRRTCAMLENMRLQDLFSAGRNLVESVRDDIRLTLVPQLVARAGLPTAARDLALVALDLGNQMLDGGGNEMAEIDLLLTQLDRMFQHGLPASLEGVKNKFLATVQVSDEKKRTAMIERVLDRVLPNDPGALTSNYVTLTAAQKKLAAHLELGTKKANACWRGKDTARRYTPADRKACITALTTNILADKIGWLDTLKKVVPSSDELLGLVDPLDGGNAFNKWLDTEAKDVVDRKEVSDALRRSCAVRVTIAIVKWCSGRDSCTAGRIATLLDDPRSLFKPPANDNSLGESLCWSQHAEQARRALHLPKDLRRHIELATRALAFLTPAPKGEERARVQAILHWMFDLAKTIDPAAFESIQQLEEILSLFEKRDYVRAVAQAMSMAIKVGGGGEGDDDPPEEFRTAMKLVGAFTSYLQVYEETKGLDASEAKAARKKAISSLIDGATDRKARSGDRIVSIGSNVAFGSTWTNEIALESGNSQEFALRVPLELAFQRVGTVGFHLGLQVADLGQFVRGGKSDVTWSSFVAPGLDVAFLFGKPHRMFSVGAHASFVPSLDENSSPSWRFGVAVGYYVPFFDLN